MAEWLSEVSVGQWFESPTGTFEIVGVDPEHECVLIQHFDGMLEEFDFDSWLELAARPCAPPEDLSGAFDCERDDIGLERDEPLDLSLDDPLLRLEQRGL